MERGFVLILYGIGRFINFIYEKESQANNSVYVVNYLFLFLKCLSLFLSDKKPHSKKDLQGTLLTNLFSMHIQQQIFMFFVVFFG